MEKVIETKTCKHCGEPFNVTNQDISMLDKLSPIIGKQRFQLPVPTLCPDCRLQRRLVFRNDKRLYRKKSDFTGENIISIYSPDKNIKIYEQNIWHGDQRNPLDYGIELNLQKSFFEQFDLLYKEIPHPAVINEMAENSEYCHHCAFMKNCYLVFASANCEDCYYSYRAIESKHVYDAYFVNKSDTIFQSVDIDNSHSLFYSQNCKNCSYGRYLYNCDNCHNCLACVNLCNASYCIQNKQYTKEEYQQYFSEHIVQMTPEKFAAFHMTFPRKNLEIVGSENVEGDIIYNSKDVQHSFGIRDSENIRYSYDIYNKISDCMDCFSGYGPVQKVYESIAV